MSVNVCAPARSRRVGCRRARWWIAVLSWLFLPSCSEQTPEPHARSLDDLFDAAAPVQISDALVWSLTNRVSDREAERLGSSLGRISLKELRSGSAPGPASVPEGFARTVVAGERLATSVAPIPREVLDIPYWTGIFRRLGAESGARVYVATNLFYRIYTFVGDRGPVDSITVAPPSWREARRPREDEFPPERGLEWSSYLDSLTVLDGLAVIHDSVLIVSIGKLRAATAPVPFRAPSLLQVYVGGQHVGVDLSSPGDLVAYSNSSVFFLVPDSRPGAKLAEYVWRGDAAARAVATHAAGQPWQLRAQIYEPNPGAPHPWDVFDAQ